MDGELNKAAADGDKETRWCEGDEREDKDKGVQEGRSERCKE